MTNLVPAPFERYRIDPKTASVPPDPRKAEWSWVSPNGWAVGFYLLLWVFLINPIIVALVLSKNQDWFIFLSPLVTFALYGLHGAIKGQVECDRIEEANRIEWRRQTELLVENTKVEAEATARELRAMLVSAAQLRAGLFVSLEEASNALDQALFEHRERAYAPFGDAVEAAAAALTNYRQGIEQISRTAQRYYATLDSRSHSFPPFPFLLVDLPVADEVLKRLRQVVRAGQTDFEFANIWEHRKTRETIATGFGSLESAVRRVGTSIVRRLMKYVLLLIQVSTVWSRNTLSRPLL